MSEAAVRWTGIENCRLAPATTEPSATPLTKTVTVTPETGTDPETTTSAGNEATGFGVTVKLHGPGDGGGSSAAADVASTGNAASATIALITPIRESLRTEVRTFLPPVEGLWG